MATDLSARATSQRTALQKAAGEIRTDLADARTELDRRHPQPATVARADWGTELGASQHAEIARAALGAARAAEAAIRARLATVTTAADANTYEAELRALLIDNGALRVLLRHAEERVAAARARVDGLGRLAAQAEAELSAADDRAAWADEHQTLGESLRASLTEPPLSSIVADAAAARTGPAMEQADTVLGGLLPASLRDRASQREGEAAAAVAALGAHYGTVTAAIDELDRSASPGQAEAAITTREFLAAEAALRGYVTSAGEQLQMASSLLSTVAGHPALSAAQAAALAVANNASGDDAASAEADLAAALEALGAAEAAVADAVLVALLADPEADPETDQDVIDARAALNDATIQGPVTAARAAYDDAARAALDQWEVEVPPTLWDALGAFLLAGGILTRLDDQAALDALVDALDTSQDALAAALDDLDVATRARWAAQLVQIDRRARLAAAEATAADRRLQYLRGDGPSGRTPAEL